MSVLVLGIASYPSLLPNSEKGVDITNDLQLHLGNLAFADEDDTEDGDTEDGDSGDGVPDLAVDTEFDDDGDSGDEDEIELKGILTDNGDGTFNLLTVDGTETISTNADTEIDDGLSLSDLDGLEVEVEAVEINGVLFATEIEFDEEEVDAILAIAEDEDEIEIEVEVKDGVAKVEVEFDDQEFEFLVTGDISKDAVAAAIQAIQFV